MPEDDADPAAAIRAYMAGLRRRAWAQWVARSLSIAGAAAGVALVAASAVAGPVATPGFAVLAWSVIAISTGAALWRGLQPARTLRGDGLTGVLQTQGSALPSRVRTALELQPDDSPQGEALRRAHIRSVEATLLPIAPQHLLPWARLRTPQNGGALFGILLCFVLLTTQEPLRTGARSLWRPASAQGDGVLRAHVVANVEARLVFPSYLNRNSETLFDPTEVRAPRGTTVELSVEPALEVATGAALIEDHEVRLRKQHGRLVGRFVVRRDGPLAIRLREGQRWFEDSTARSVHALSDHTPEIVLNSPITGAWVQPDANQLVDFEATDDTGLTAIDVAVRLPGGSEHRRRVWSASQAGGVTQSLQTQASVLPRALGVRPGDRFELWLEARDGDVVTGPNIGHSAIVVLEAASDAQHLSQHLPKLRALLDQSLDVLADRLEQPVPESLPAARTRHTGMRNKTVPMLATLQQLIAAVSGSTDGALDGDALLGVYQRQNRLLRQEQGIYGQGQRHAARVAIDGKVIDELERDTLLIEDMLAAAHVEEAGALAEELQRLQQRISELLQQLDKADSEEARQALAAEIARAEGRLRELMRSLSQMATQVPSEFVNEQALDNEREPSAADNLRDLRSAVGSGDLDSAAQHLQALQDKLMRLAESLQEGGLKLRQARHGPQDEALSDAQEQLSMLADEQGRLAQRSGERLRDAMRRAAPGEQAAQDGLKKRADQLGEALDAIEDGDRDPTRRRMFDQARQRVADTRDALQTGDLSEAKRMAGAAQRALGQAADGMEMESRMYQGHDGKAGERAKRAREAAEEAAALQKGIDRRIPDLSEHLSPQDRGQMRGDARSQGQLRDKAQALQDAVDMGPDGLPLSPDGSQTLAEATEQMRRAEQQLQQGDAEGATSAQEEATEKLQLAAKQLRDKQQQGQGDGEGQGDQRPTRPGDPNHDGEGRDGRMGSHAPVKIPGDEDFDAPQAMRRRLLDAMREARPAGFEQSVELYYQELLR